MKPDQSPGQNEVIEMINNLYSDWEGTKEEFEYLMKRFFIACAYAIWELLPQEASRKGIKAAEQFMMGGLNDEEYLRAWYYAEGAAFNIDYNCSPGDIKKWVNDIKLIPYQELCKMIHPAEAIKNYKPKKLLLNAAYFADFVIKYPDYHTISGILNPPAS